MRIALRLLIVPLLVCAGCVSRPDNALEAEDLMPLPIGESFSQIEQAHLARPMHQFTVPFEEGILRGVVYRIEQKKGGNASILLLFKNDRLIKISKTIPGQMSYGARNHQWNLLGYDDFMEGVRRIRNAPALTQRQLREIAAGGYEGGDWMAPWRVPAAVIEVALLPVHLPFRLLVAGHDQGLRNQYDPFRVHLGASTEEVDATLGSIQYKGMDLQGREFHLFAPEEKLWGSGLIPPIVVWFKDGRAVAIGSGWYASGQPLRHEHRQPGSITPGQPHCE